MIKEIKEDAEDRMDKTLGSLDSAFAKIRTGRAHPSILDGVMVDYYGTDTPLKQVANIIVEDAQMVQKLDADRIAIHSAIRYLHGKGFVAVKQNLSEGMRERM